MGGRRGGREGGRKKIKKAETREIRMAKCKKEKEKAGRTDRERRGEKKKRGSTGPLHRFKVRNAVQILLLQ